MDDYRGNESRTSSDTSGLTGDEQKQFAQQDSRVTESMSTEWTDEKHNLYLKSMEASFVNQLYNSMDHLGWYPQKNIKVPKLSQLVNCDASTPSGQFTVLQHGSRRKISFRRPESQLNPKNESYCFLTSPWIRHYGSARKPQVTPVLQENAASKGQEINLNVKNRMSSRLASFSKHSDRCNSFSCYHDLVDSNAEMSDQNFIDEDTKGENAISTCSSKRMRIRTNDASRSDQVVPHSKHSMAEDVNEKNVPAARKFACTNDRQLNNHDWYL